MKKLFNIFMKARAPGPYTLGLLGLAFISSAFFIGINFAVNDFGLWNHRDTARIWALEKTTKYLLAQRYVPENFDAVMIGASVSANMDTRRLHGYRVYNLSMSGGNITETGAAAQEYLKASGDKKLLIVTLHPYMTKNSGMKSFQISDKDYWGSLFSLTPLRILQMKIQYALGRDRMDFKDSEAGWNNFNFPETKADMAAVEKGNRDTLAAIRAGQTSAPKAYPIDPVAVSELDALLKLAREKGVKIAAYYFPLLGSEYDIMAYSGDWKKYQSAMKPLFQADEIILDMNTPKFDYLRRDPNAYHDSGHLSQTGANVVLDKLNQVLKEKHLVK